MAPTGPIAARSAVLTTPSCRRSISWGAVTCWPTWWRSSDPWTSCSGASIDEYARWRRGGPPARELRLHGGEPRQGEGDHREVSAGPAGERRAAAPRPRPTPARQLAAARRDGHGGGAAGDACDPRLRSRDLLHDVQFEAGREASPPDLHDDAVLAPGLRRGRPRLRAQ